MRFSIFIIGRFDKPKDVIIKLTKNLPKPLKNSAMSTLEMIKLEGKQEGRQEEKIFAIKNFLREGVQTEVIARALKVSLKYVKSIKAKMIKNGEL